MDSPNNLAWKLTSFFDKQNGFFIEAGACNGIWQSNTLYLETELNWHGLLIEPNPTAYEDCIGNRNNGRNIFYNCALVSSDYNKDYAEGYFNELDYENSLMAQVIVDNPLFSPDDDRWHNKEKIKVPARKLSDILDENNISNIDFFSLDVEGYELNVLDGIDFSRHRPNMICVESWGHKCFFKVKQKLETNGYMLRSVVTESDFLFEKLF